MPGKQNPINHFKSFAVILYGWGSTGTSVATLT